MAEKSELARKKKNRTREKTKG